MTKTSNEPGKHIQQAGETTVHSALPRPVRLTMRRISKSYGPVRVLSDVDLTVCAGEIHALMGENGAGKSTLIKILSGAIAPDAGSEIHIDGQLVKVDNPRIARELGISVIHQELALATNLTVAQNIFLGCELRKAGLVAQHQMTQQADAVLARLGASFQANTRVSALTLAERQLVEIARAIHADARILVMDEPTTTLSTRETEQLFTLIGTLRTQGISIIYISHRMAEIYELADSCSVLRDGKMIGTLARDEIKPEKLVAMMVGRDLSQFYRRANEQPPGDLVLEVCGFSDGALVKDCSFSLKKSEIVGLAGLVGAGRTELAKLVYGLNAKTTGTLRLCGQALTISSPRDALAHGIAYLTEDRKGDGLLLEMSVADNASLCVMGQDAGWPYLLNRTQSRSRAQHALESLSIRAASIHAHVSSLSGGNQQKVLLARLLALAPRVVILDEPTRGVDIGAKSEIYRIIEALAQQGTAVLVISSELAEIVGLCDRSLVMCEGRIAGEVGRRDGMACITEENIIALATGNANLVMTNTTKEKNHHGAH